MPAHGFATGICVVDITCCFMFVNLDVSILLLYGLWKFGYGYPYLCQQNQPLLRSDTITSQNHKLQTFNSKP